MIKALLIDDSRLARNELRRLLQEHPTVEILGEAQHAREALDLTEQLRPDLLFLDIQMPGQNGFELLEQLEYMPQVIFTTAFDHYAIRAFEHNALDYLLKPIQPQRLSAALLKLEESVKKPLPEQVQSYFSADSQVFVKDGEKCWFVPIAMIRLLEVCGNYTRIFFDQEKPLILRSLNYMEQRLDSRMFFRANRQQIINLRQVDRLEPWFSGSLKLYLRGGEVIEVSRRQAQRFKELMSF